MDVMAPVTAALTATLRAALGDFHASERHLLVSEVDER
jgi:hypothetical protein